MDWEEDADGIKARFVKNLDATRIRKIAIYFDRHSNPISFEDCSAYRLAVGNDILNEPMLARAEEILPAMLEMITPKKPMDLMRFVNGVLAAAVLTSLANAGRRQGSSDKKRKEVVTKFYKLVAEMDKLVKENSALGSAIDSIETQFELHFGNLPNFGFGEGPIVIRTLRLIEKILKAENKIGAETVQFFDTANRTSKPKLNSVEKAAYLCRRFGGPAVVTTPSSQFSLFTSLLHEIATGDRDESMQGAIISFSKGNLPMITADDGGQLDDFDLEEFEDWDEARNWHRAKVAKLVLSQTKDRSLEKALLIKMEMESLSEISRIVASRRARQKII